MVKVNLHALTIERICFWLFGDSHEEPVPHEPCMPVDSMFKFALLALSRANARSAALEPRKASVVGILDAGTTIVVPVSPFEPPPETGGDCAKAPTESSMIDRITDRICVFFICVFFLFLFVLFLLFFCPSLLELCPNRSSHRKR